MHSVRVRISLERALLPYESYATRGAVCIDRHFMRLNRPGLAQFDPRAVLLADAAPNYAALIRVTTFAPMTDKAE